MEAFSSLPDRRAGLPWIRLPSCPPSPTSTTMQKEVRSLLDRLHLERDLGGVSMGGYVAFECMRLFPEGRPILANTRPEPDSEEMREIRRDGLSGPRGSGIQ